ncbi:hypothetical protein [Haloferula sp.]|uniref:hypothetical protein n=1 Tax=Haloferula sp. TaxID=2497595 RepID=UPI003C77413C
MKLLADRPVLRAASILILSLTTIAWIAQLLSWTVGYGKVNSGLPDWMVWVWFYSVGGAGLMSLLIAGRVMIDPTEEFTPILSLVLISGVAPALALIAYIAARS